MLYSYFESGQIFPLIISSLLLVSSIILFEKKLNLSLILLFGGTIGMGYFMANLDHFLILWDEQYHALVAKNLAKNLLTPTLYLEPILDFDYKNWTANHIWLHKQPLFLWQMALSVKLFGATELAIRIPSIIMHAIIPLFIYRIGTIALNKRAAYYGALFFAVAYFPLELIVGRYSSDHNDIAFLFYVTASFWSWFEYKDSKKTIWLILIGLFSGGAFLVKWFMGLLVLVIWGVSKLIAESNDTFRIKSYLPILFSGLISLVVFIPWQIYIRLAFPKESSYEFALNAKHFFEPIEGHSGGIWFHFTEGLKLLYGSGDAMPFILLIGVILMLIRISNRTYRVGIAATIIFVYLFYTIAATKMIAFTLIVSPFIYLGLGTLIDFIISIIEKKIKVPIIATVLGIIIPIVIAFTALNLTKIQNYHTMWKPHDNHNRVGEIAEMNFVNSLKKILGDEEYVIFNVKITVNGHIPIMFYTDYLAYNFIPNQAQIEKIRENDKKIAIVNVGKLPDYITNDKEIKILDNRISP